MLNITRPKHSSKENRVKYTFKIPSLRPSTEQGVRNLPSRSSVSTEKGFLRGFQYRYRSNQVPALRSQHQTPLLRPRVECQSQKKQRKSSSKPSIGQVNIFRPQAEPRKHCVSKTFIGSKLKKNIQSYLLFLSLVNYSRNCSFMKPEKREYKVYIGKGNNSKLVRQIFTNRFWWTVTNNEAEANLIWSQKISLRALERIQPFELLQCNEKRLPEVKQAEARLRCKNKRAGDAEGFEKILNRRSSAWIRGYCVGDEWMQKLRQALKKAKAIKRRAIGFTHNHLENHRTLTNKKSLFSNMVTYCRKEGINPFSIIPITFHLQGQEPDLTPLLSYQNQCIEKNEKLLWIVKPGQNSNRGCGIEVCKKVQQISAYIEAKKSRHPSRTWIVQKYITPCLYHRRKFDIRCFVLVTATPLVSGYFFPQGYLRTSSFLFTKRNCSNLLIHLTNDAVQKKGGQYSKFQDGNKASFEDLQRHLELADTAKKINFFTHVLPQMKQMVAVSLRAARDFQNSKKEHTFEILGYDFMLDEELKPWLIEINTNPCLQTDCELLQQIIPTMLQNAVKIAVDSVLAPPKLEDWTLNQLLTCPERILESNQFELIYSQSESIDQRQQ